MFYHSLQAHFELNTDCNSDENSSTVTVKYSVVTINEENCHRTDCRTDFKSVVNLLCHCESNTSQTMYRESVQIRTVQSL